LAKACHQWKKSPPLFPSGKQEGKVKIADFGIARIVGDPRHDFTLTRTGNAFGSISYMAPEQHERPHDVDRRADIYSLGVVLYEMLTGELPLGRFPSPSQRAAVDSRIDEIVLKTLAKEREMRQQSVTELKTEVNRARQPDEINPSSPAASRKSRLFPVIAKLAGGWLLTGVLGIGFMMRIDFGFQERVIFGLICGLPAFLLGLISWRERLRTFLRDNKINPEDAQLKLRYGK
jgi:serine/threonine protein kinase